MVADEITGLYDQIFKKMYKLGTMFYKVEQNMQTIEKYCENSLKETFKASDIYAKLKQGFFATCSQLKRPGSIYTNQLKPLCQKSVQDFQGIYDVEYCYGRC